MNWTRFWDLFWIEMTFGGLAFLALFFISAPYGRHVKRGWGPTMNSRTAWIVQEFPAFAVILAYFLQSEAFFNPVTIAFIIIWQVHYTHRTFVYPFSLTSPEKPYPVLLVGMAIVFNTINGILNGSELFILRTYELSWFWSPQFIIGLLLFVGGYVLNKQSDRILTNLRLANTDEYRIPFGGAYRYVSCPNYLGEIIEWLGWAILTWSFAGLGFFLFTIANLFPRALSNHRWYRRKFTDYPADRKAIIPFLI